MMNHVGMKIMTLVLAVFFANVCRAETPAIKKIPPAPIQVQPTMPKVIKKIDPPLGKLTITSPKTGDYLVEGREFVIRWSAEGFVPEKCVRITYIHQMPFGPFEINPRVCVNGYRWNVPPNTLGNDIYIVITTLDQKVTAQSPRFAILSSKPDLTLYSSSTMPKEPTSMDRDKLKLNATIINTQTGRSAPCQARIIFGPKYGNSSQQVSKIFDVPALNLGERYAISLSWPPSVPLAPGQYSFQIDLDITNVVDELSEENNHRDQFVLVQGVPNLVVCVKEHLEAITTQNTKLKAIVKNTGEVAAGHSVARWWIEGHGTELFNLPSILQGEEYAIQREVTWLTGGTDNFTIEVDKNNQVQELSETDNVKNGTIHRHVWGTPIAPFDNSPKCP